MLIVYSTRTGNVRRFVNKITNNAIKIEKDLIVNEPFILITYTTGKGDIPLDVLNFLQNNYKYIIGVSASGSKNWGNSYAMSADKISNMYNVPIISKFELSGFKTDIEYFKIRVSEIERESYSVEQ